VAWNGFGSCEIEGVEFAVQQVYEGVWIMEIYHKPMETGAGQNRSRLVL